MNNDFFSGFDKPAFQIGPAKPQPKKRPRGGFWSSLISEGGALGGAATGAAAGSVVPGIGTVIGGLVGGGIGAFGGRIAENKVRDNRLGIGDAAKEGALTTVLGGPLRLGKYAVTASKGLGKTNLEDALLEAAGKANAPGFMSKKVGGVIGNKLTNASDNLATRAIKVNDSQWSTDFANRTGEEVGQFATRFNIVGKNKDQIMNEVYRPALKVYSQGLKTIGSIPKKEVLSSIKAELDVPLKSAFPEDKLFAKEVMKKTQALLGGFGDDIPATELNKLKSQAYSKVNTKLADEAGIMSNNINKTIAQSIRRAITGAAEKRGVQVDPAVMKSAKLNFKSGNLGDFGEELFALKELAQKIDVKSRVGKGKSIFGLSASTTGVGGAVLGGPVGAAIGVGASTALNSPKLARKGSTAFNALGNKLTSKATTPVGVSGGARKGFMGQTKESLLDAILGAQSSEGPNSINNIMGSMTNTATTANTPDMSEQYQDNTEMSSGEYIPSWMQEDNSAEQEQAGQTITREQALQAMMDDIATTGGKNLEKIKTIYEFANPEVDAKAPKPLNQNQQDRADLIRSLDLTEGAVNKGSINYGPVGSRLEGFKSIFNAADPETLAFKNQISGLRAAITKARAGASLTTGELALLQKYTPSDTDSEQTIRSKLAQLRALYGSQAPVGGSSLEDVLMNQSRDRF